MYIYIYISNHVYILCMYVSISSIRNLCDIPAIFQSTFFSAEAKPRRLLRSSESSLGRAKAGAVRLFGLAA